MSPEDAKKRRCSKLLQEIIAFFLSHNQQEISNQQRFMRLFVSCRPACCKHKRQTAIINASDESRISSAATERSARKQNLLEPRCYIILSSTPISQSLAISLVILCIILCIILFFIILIILCIIACIRKSPFRIVS